MEKPTRDTVLKAFTQLEALYELEKSSNIKTTRSRNEILKCLSDPDMIAIAIMLKNRGYTGGAK